MRNIPIDTAAAPPLRDRAFRLRAADVTGTLEIEADLQPDVPAGAVAQTLAQRMELPADVPWALRNSRGAFLDDERQIGEQIEADARVTLTPKTHLG
ncbi:MAG TPA: hypothetical protein P5555_19320 [Candidatus Paceibacterota bacterium]|nr:hypothetical protein [Verrucomicrobiota bacterium]HOX04416.1 hypothetical protein [Verrucomicrobiota bacterium]HRZ47336.1 hypothetical protein [Candidatus Paceibacterota bacterium]HRZ93372.1 hypothetical protein [Candidatus Paceibacterota bacterium]